MSNRKIKVGDWVSTDGWPDKYRVCKVTSRSIYLWTGKRGYFSHRMYFTTPILSRSIWAVKLANKDSKPSHEEYHTRAFGEKNFHPFKRL